MRLAAQVKGGFYPAHERAVALAASYLQPPVGVKFAILDPCAGEGTAIRQLGELLRCPPTSIHAIEMDDRGLKAIRAALPEAHVLAPADFFGCRASFGSFSFIWLNPPFDYSYGGCRVEDQFLMRATEWLMPDGVMALVCPEDVVEEYSEARQHFTRFYENVTLVPFPEAHRPFKEVIVLGHKRKRLDAEPDRLKDWQVWESIQAPKGFRYRIPEGNGPRVFQKVQPTEPELEGMLVGSPLRSYSEIATRNTRTFSAAPAGYWSCGPAARQRAFGRRGASEGQTPSCGPGHVAKTFFRQRRNRHRE